MPDTTSPVSMELPEEIERAIESLIDEAKYEGGRFSASDGKDIDRVRSALTAAILSRLAAVEAERDEALREHTDMMWQRRRADERDDAALARVERLEKAVRTTPPDGWVLVPKEPTRAMLDAVSKQVDDFSREHFRLFTRDLWADLLTSASEAPSQGDQ